ncbi:hypothetical protein IJU85_02675 [Candidatus Saccharibacteria bacterium]|nr:hypothetical protein [Candidatus Saccharibacteria bacterium]
MYNKGTYEGDIDEIKFVRIFNSDKENFKKYLDTFTNDPSNYWMVRVTTKQTSHLNEKKVFTRADCYLAEITDNSISDILDKNSLYLSEEILETNHIRYRKIPKSGVSVKMTTSDNFQILKVRPDSFFKLFGTYELGAGASLFCLREEELIKNNDLFDGWKTTASKMTDYYSQITKGDRSFYLDKHKCADIKTYASNKIKETIDNDTILQQKVFNGIFLYEEPYPAYYFYHGDDIEVLTTLPYYVTTGSGRSHGDYTIVLKPVR